MRAESRRRRGRALQSSAAAVADNARRVGSRAPHIYIPLTNSRNVDGITEAGECKECSRNGKKLQDTIIRNKKGKRKKRERREDKRKYMG
eukprot:2928762-Pleurochrysis_carterae.AAC.5